MRLPVLTFTMAAALTVTAAQACGPEDSGHRHRNPQIGVILEWLIPRTRLSPTEAGMAHMLRVEIARRLLRGDEAGARQIEERAMRIVGLRKQPLDCGADMFRWRVVLPAKRQY